MQRAISWLCILLALGGLGFAARRYLQPKPLEVEVYRASRGDVRETVTSPSSGTIVSPREATVAAEANGRVARLVLKPGDRAAEGAVVVQLEDDDAKVEVRATEAALGTRRTALAAAELRAQKAEDDFQAAVPLHERKLTSDDQFRALRSAREIARVDVDAARAALREAEVAVERSQVALRKRVVRAPFSGVVRRKLVEAGEFVAIGRACFEIYDDANLFIRAPIDEVDVPRLRLGFPVDVQLGPYGDRLFRGVVRDIEPGVRAAKELNRTVDVEVDLKDAPRPQEDGSYPAGEGPLKVGMSADVEIITRTRGQVLRVLRQAVHETEDRFHVYLVREEKIEKRFVEIGLSNWDYAEIVEGLAEGDPVVVSLDQAGIEDGKPATIKREKRKADAE